MGITALLGLLAAGCIQQESVSLPGVVVSEDRATVFCSNRERRLVALRMDSGKPAWTSQEKGWPLAVMGPDLIIATLASDPHAFYLKVLGAADGNFRVMSRPIVLPNWAKPVLNYDKQEGYDFGIRAEPFSEAKVHVYWSARKWQAGGIAMNPRFAQAQAKEDAAGLEFHVGSGTLADIEPPSEPVDYGLLGGQPDPSRPSAHVLSKMLNCRGRTLYISESAAGPNDPVRPLQLICLPANGTDPLWTFSLGDRNVPRLRM